MIRNLRLVTEVAPALMVVLVSAYMASMLLISVFPGSSAAWQVFMALAPMGRDMAGLIPELTPPAFALTILALLTIAAGFILVMRRPTWVRSRFLVSHSTFLMLLVAMRGEQVFTASLDESPVRAVYSLVPDIGAMNPVLLVVGVGIIMAAMSAHRSILLRLRHPVRSVR